MQGWRQVLKQGAKHCVLVLDDVWDGDVLDAFVDISPKIRIVVTTIKQKLWPHSRAVVLKPGHGVWHDDAGTLKLLALHAFGQGAIREGFQVTARSLQHVLQDSAK